MKLLVISHTPHYRQGDQIVGWGPTVRELDYLAGRFEEVIHLAILHPSAPPASSLPYTAENLRLALLPPSGGERLRDKGGVLKLAPTYLGEIRRQLRRADVVQVRCPAAISLLALLALGFAARPRYRWFKYAGNWRPSAGGEALSYRLQRWLLARGWGRGPVAVNGRWPGQPAHVYSLDNPCLTQAEVEEAQRLAAAKTLDRPLRLLFVGRAERAKGLGQALQIVAGLREHGLAVQFDVVGDGPERQSFEAQAHRLGLQAQTRFHGFLPRAEIGALYARAHFLLHPSTSSEGWPKVLSEAMAYGALPLAGDVSGIPQTLAEIGCGAALPAAATERYIATILAYLERPERWQAEAQRGREAASRFTYPAYGAALEAMFRAYWGVPLLA